MVSNIYHIKNPTKVITTILGIPTNYKQECINEIYNIGGKPNIQSNVKAIRSSYNVWEETNVYNLLLDKIKYTIKNIIPLEDLRYEYSLASAWTIIYKKDHYAVSHSHEPSFLSFVYYLKVGKFSSPLIFDNCDFSITPQEDLLIIFPSYLTHSVPKQIEEEDRICLAGNLNLEPKNNRIL